MFFKTGRGYIPFLLLLSSCGIPSTSYMPPVPDTSVESPLTAETLYSFSNPDPDAVNPEVFEGFEIYYTLVPTENADEYDESGDPQLESPVSWNEP